MTLIIAEKPDLGKAIATAIAPGGKRGDGFIDAGEYIITWAFGHLFTLRDPQDYDVKYKSWSLGMLPIFFEQWAVKPDSKKQDQIKLIQTLLGRADMVIHAGDPDDEGQLLIDEILDYFGYKGKILRLSTNDLTPTGIQKEFKKMRDNSEYRSIGRAAYARSVADFALGINYSRYFSLKNDQTLSVGRVQTPTLGLVVARDALIDGHVKVYFYEAFATIPVLPETICALRLILPEGHLALDADGRVTDKAALERLALPLKGKSVDVIATKRKQEEQPPLPFNLTKLQSAAFQRFKLTPEETLKLTQTLREKYKLITYNRSTCQYLNDEQFAEAPATVAAALSNLGATIPRLDPSRKSRAFSSKNVGDSAHTGIIPTKTKYDLSKLTASEKNVYRLIAAQYLAQFMPNAIKEITTLTAPLKNKFKLEAKASRIVDKGYREVLPTGDSDGEDNIICTVPEGSYPGRTITDMEIRDKETKPPARYTLASLNEDMSSVAKYVTDVAIKKILLAKDDGKKGENGGIGTPATRTSIVQTLLKRGYIEVKDNKVFATELGKEFYGILPDEVKKPDLTAKWWAICEDIKDKTATPEILFTSVMDSVETLLKSNYKRVESAHGSGSGGSIEVGTCPRCGRAMRKGGKNFYCTGYKDTVKPCPFKLYPIVCGKKLTDTQVKTLITSGRVAVKGLTSKSGSKFGTTLALKPDDSKEGFAQFEFKFGKSK